MRELRLSEELFLLAFNKEKRKFPPSSSAIIKYGLPAAVLYELHKKGMIEIEEETVLVADSSPTGDELFDLTLKNLSPLKRKLQFQLSKLSSQARKFQNLIIKNLLSEEIIKEERETSGELFSKKEYRLWYEMPLNITREKLNEITLYGKEADERYLTLIALIQACKFTRKIFKNTADYKNIEKRLKDLTEKNPLASAITNLNRASYLSLYLGLLAFVFMLIKELCS